MSLRNFYSQAWIQAHKKQLIAAVFALILIIALVWYGVANAATVSLSWQNPTRNLDNTLIPATGDGSLAGTRIEFGSCAAAGAFAAKLGEFTVPAPAATAVSPDLAPGTSYCFRAFAKNTFGNESDASNVVAKAILTPKPAPPVLSVVSTVAYAVAISKFRLVLGQPVGTVPLGTACIADTQLGSTPYFAVPFKSVKVTNKTSSPVFLAKCGLG